MNPRSAMLARTTGLLFAALGTIHCAATPLVLAGPEYASLELDAAATFTVMFLGTGLAVFWAGVTFLFAVPALRRGDAWPRRVLTLAAAFLATLSLLCVCPMPSNPFAWLALAGACLGVWTAMSAPRASRDVAEGRGPSEVVP